MKNMKHGGKTAKMYDGGVPRMPTRVRGPMGPRVRAPMPAAMPPAMPAGAPGMMAKGGKTSSKMGTVKTAAPSRDGVAIKGKTKGKMITMRKGGRAC